MPLLRLQLVIDKSLASLPRRQTDGSIVIRSQDNDAGKARIFKLNATPQDPILVERYVDRLLDSDRSSFVPYSEGGHERQYRFHCPRCNLLIGYQSTPPPVKSGPFVYILKGALSQVQGQVPSDAFEDENRVRPQPAASG